MSNQHKWDLRFLEMAKLFDPGLKTSPHKPARSSWPGGKRTFVKKRPEQTSLNDG